MLPRRRFAQFCLLLCGSAAQNSLAQPNPVGRMIDIGGRKLHLGCSGKGTPVVTLVHGTGAYSFDRGLVQPRVAYLTRVCSYDRAGHAWLLDASG